MQPSSEPIFQFMTPNGNSKQEVRSAAARSAHARARRARMLEYQAADKSKKVEPQDANRELSPLSNSYNLQMSHRASIVLASPVLGYERRDPFGSLAIQCSPFEQYLLDHCSWPFHDLPIHKLSGNIYAFTILAVAIISFRITFSS
jgi:hypothetical protein